MVPKDLLCKDETPFRCLEQFRRIEERLAAIQAQMESGLTEIRKNAFWRWEYRPLHKGFCHFMGCFRGSRFRRRAGSEHSSFNFPIERPKMTWWGWAIRNIQRKRFRLPRDGLRHRRRRPPVPNQANQHNAETEADPNQPEVLHPEALPKSSKLGREEI